ncbi:hypothetical protein [Vibrio atypicus]|uniref:hypothetical protein n=1 Tax=Vibrio atypicus TaxID=558271 RepID=UPI00135CD075|nr:hypothetical protein [Vibrio atypicus]
MIEIVYLYEPCVKKGLQSARLFYVLPILLGLSQIWGDKVNSNHRLRKKFSTQALSQQCPFLLLLSLLASGLLL